MEFLTPDNLKAQGLPRKPFFGLDNLHLSCFPFSFSNISLAVRIESGFLHLLYMIPSSVPGNIVWSAESI